MITLKSTTKRSNILAHSKTCFDTLELPNIWGTYCICENSTGVEKIAYIGSTRVIRDRIRCCHHPYYKIVKKYGYKYVYIRYKITRDYRETELLLLAKYQPEFNIRIPINPVNNNFKIAVFSDYIKLQILKNKKIMSGIAEFLDVGTERLQRMVIYDCQRLFHISILENIKNEIGLNIK